MKYLKRIWKKGVALLLAATMSLSLLPVTALAAGEDANLISSVNFAYDGTNSVTGSIKITVADKVTVRVTLLSDLSTTSGGLSDMGLARNQSFSPFSPNSTVTKGSRLELSTSTYTFSAAGSVTLTAEELGLSISKATLISDIAASSRYQGCTATKVPYYVIVYDSQGNYYSKKVFDVDLAAEAPKAELEANPTSLMLVKGGNDTVALTNIIDGTTAKKITVTSSSTDVTCGTVGDIAYGTPGTLAIAAGSSAATTTTPHKVTVNYYDSADVDGDTIKPGATQKSVEIEVTIIAAEGWITGAISDFGPTALTQTATFDLAACARQTGTFYNYYQILPTTIAVTSGFSFTNGDNSGIIATNNTDLTTGFFFDYTKDVPNCGSNRAAATGLSGVTITADKTKLTADDTNPVGYLTFDYYQAMRNSAPTQTSHIQGTTGGNLRTCVVPLYYKDNGTPTEPVVTFSAGTGGTLTGSATPTVAGGIVASVPTATRTGYKFLGWNDGTSDYTSAQVAARKHEADTTYTAQWEQQYRVAYDPNLPTGATVSNMPTSPSAYLDKGSNYTLVGTPSCSGATDGKAYKFKGWGASAGATTTITAINNITEDTTVYAIWEALPQVTFKIGTGGKFSDSTTADKTLNANASGIVTAPGVTANTGYSFKGWNDGTSTLTETQVNAKNHDADTTYTAQWELRKVASGTPDANNNLVEGATISLEKVTLSTGDDILKAGYGTADLANFEWYIVNSGVTPVPGTHTPVQSNNKTGNFVIPTGTAPTQHVWVLVKGGGTNISDEPCLIDMGPVGVESFTYEVEIHVNGSKPASVPNGLTATLSATNLEAGKSYGVTASVGGDSTDKYKFAGWSDSLTSGSSFSSTTGEVSVYSVPATTTGTGLVSKPGKNYIYANFVPVPHLKLDPAGGETGSQAFKGTVTNDGAATAYQVTYTLEGGDATKFDLNKTNPTSSQLAAAGTDSLTVTCNGTDDGTTYTTTLKITYSDSATGSVVGTITQPISFTYIEPRKTVYVNIQVDSGTAQNAVSGITVTPDVDHKVTLKKEETTLVSTNTAASSGYRFKSWSSNLGDSSATVTNTGGTGTFKMSNPAVDTVITANYITVPYLTLAATTAGEHYYGVNTVTNATATVTNSGKANATAVKVSVGDSRFTLASGGMNATGNTVNANNGTGTIQIAPVNAAGLAVGVYTIPVTVTYKQESTDADITVTTNVTYEVKETSYTLTVVTSPAAGVTKVEYKKNSDNMATYSTPITVKSSDTVTLIATMANGYTGTWTVGSTCTANINSGTVLGLSGFTNHTTATITATAAANLTLKPTPGSGTKGDASTLTAPKVEISNSGAGAATISSITFTSVTDNKSFTVSPANGTVNATNGTLEVTLTPASGWDGWDAKTYTGLVTVTYTDPAHGDTDQTATTYASFTLNAPSTFTGKVTVKWDDTDNVTGKVTGVTLSGTDSPTGTQSGNTWTFANLSSDTAYAITVATGNGNVTSTQTLNNGNQEVIIYLSNVSVASNNGSQGSVKLDNAATPLTKTYEAGTAVDIAATATSPYKFDKWQKGGTDTALGASATVLAEKTSVTYKAYFTQDFKLKYDGNSTDAANVPVDLSSYKTGDTATVSQTKPTRPGYGFAGWNTAANGSGTNYAASTDADPVTITMNSDVTLYAKWLYMSIADDGYTEITDTTKYGDNYSTNKVASAVRALNSGVPLKFSDASLTGSNLDSIGLTIDESGNISGRPYKVGTFNFSIKAAHANNSNAFNTYGFTLTVGKAQPVISNVVVSGNLTGAKFSDAKYTYTVTAPKYVGGTDKWEDASELMKSTTAVTLPQGAATNAGVVSLAAPNTTFTAAAQNLTVNYAPGATTDAAKPDTTTNAYSAIYENATLTLSVAGNAVSEALSISPNPHSFDSVDDDGTGITQTNYTQPGAYQFTVKNEGNVTTGTITVTAPTGYTITTALSQTTLAPGETATFSIQPDAHLAVGTHPGVISASYTSAQTGTPTISASAGVDFEVKAPNFSGYITVKKQGTTDAQPVGDNISTVGYTLKLVPVEGGDPITTFTYLTDGNPGRHKFTGADSTKNYNIVVSKGGVEYTVPGRLVNKDNKTSQGVVFYELELARDTNTGTGVTGAQSGAGWYLPGIGVAVSDSGSGTNKAFDAWKDGDSAVVANTASITYTMPSKPVTLTSFWKDTSATTCTITYDANRPATVKSDVNIWTPGPETGVAIGTAHNLNLASGTPTLLGYTFDGWFAAATGTGDSAITTVTPTGDTTVYARWTPVTMTATGTAPEGTYGTGYTGKVSVTAPDGAVAKYERVDGYPLPGGLSLDENTGAITGIPYEICTDKPVKVKVTMTNDVNTTPRTATVELTITIKAATPTITGVTATNVVTGHGVNTADYVVTVAGPKYEVNDGAGSWTTYVDTLTYKGGTGSNPPTKDTTAVGGGGLGSATFTGSDFTAAGVTVNVHYTPAGSAFDGANQNQNAVWTEPDKNFTIKPNSDSISLAAGPDAWHFTTNGLAAGGHAIEGFSVDETGTAGTVNTTTNKVAAKQFTLKNDGTKASGTLNYKFASTGTGEGTYFKLVGTPTASLAAGAQNGKFTVAVKNSDSGLPKSNYTDTLVITDGDGGSVLVSLFFYVDAPATYTATVTVYVKDVNGTPPNDGSVGTTIPAGVTVTLVPSNSANATVTLASANYVTADKQQYKVDTLVTGEVYTVKANGHSVGTLAAKGDNVDVKLFQVQLATVPTGLTFDGGAAQSGAGYYAENQTASISTPANGEKDSVDYAFTQWDDSNTTKSTAFNAIITDAVKFTATYSSVLTLTYDANGGTLTGGKVVAGSNPENHQANDPVSLQSCIATKDGFTFQGWAESAAETDPSKIYAAGASYTMPTTSKTLYAIWKANDTMSLPGNSWTVAYKDTLGDKVINAVGGIPGYTYATASGSLPIGFIFDATNHKFSGTANTYSTTLTNNTGTMTVKATDSVNKTANGDFTITVTQADTKVTTGFTVDSGYTYYDGDALDLTKLTGAVVDVMKTDGTTKNNTVNLKETPVGADGSTGATDNDGKWQIVGSTEKTVDGVDKIDFLLEFDPNDDGFKPCQTTVTVEVQKRLINTATIGITFPKQGDTPSTTGTKESVSTTPTVADPKETVADVKVSWSAGTDPFNSTVPNTVWVELTAKDGWEFDDDFVGTLKDSVSGDTKTAQVVGNSGRKLTLVYTFPANDTVIQHITVDTDNPVFNGTGTNVKNNDNHILEYEVLEYHWEVGPASYNNAGAVVGQNSVVFETDKTYDLVVKVRAREGYVFSPALFGGENGGELNQSTAWDATINNETSMPTQNPKKSFVEAKLHKESVTKPDGTSSERDVLTIRYSSFPVDEKEIAGIVLEQGKLDVTQYYAVTGTDKSGNDVNKTTAHGHGTWSAIFDNTSDTTPIKFHVVYKDGTNGDSVTFTPRTGGMSLVYGSNAVGNLPAMPANGYTFTNETDSKDEATYDKKNVYVKYELDNGKYFIATEAVGTLTVQELKADKLTPSRVWTTAELTFVKDTAFKLPTTNAPTATVDFNTGSLSHSETGWAYNATATNGSNTHYYMIDATGNDGVPETQITAATTMSDTTHNGKTLYMCYTDINDNLVYAPMGVLKVSGDTKLTVTAVNISDPGDNTDNGGSVAPEYGETLRADVKGKDGYTPTGTLTYEWQYKDTDGSWKPIPDATNPTYTLGKDDVGREIRVEVKEQGTSGSATSNEPTGNPRTLKLDVVRVSKPYDGNTNNTHTYVTTSATVNDFTLSNVLDGDTVYVSNYKGTKPVYSDSIVGSTFDWPAVTAGTTDYTLAGAGYTRDDGTAVYRLGAQAAIPNRGTITAADLITPITVTYPNTSLKPTKGGTPVNALTGFGVPTEEQDRYQIDTTATNNFYWEYSTDGSSWTKVDFTDKTGLDENGKFLKETYYRVTVPVVTKSSDLKFAPDTNPGYMVINGVRYNASADVGKDGTTTTTAQTTATVTYSFDQTAGDDEPTHVTYVSAYFQDPPAVGETIPAHPDQVGRPDETVSTDGTHNDSSAEHFVVRWYESADKTTWGSALAADYTFKAGKYYKVEVDVQAGTGYVYDENTYFAINTSAGTKEGTTITTNVGKVYTMSYIFDDVVAPIEIAHVNLSVPQPVVEETPTAHSTVTVNQALGTNGTDYKTTLTVDNVAWSTSDAFEADTVYTLEFDVATGTYDYLNETTKVDFIVSGVGPIGGENSATSTGAITEVETSTTDADKTYHVKVTFKGLKGGKVELTDVVVDASSANKAGVEKTGPEVTGTKPYDLLKDSGAVDATKSKWEYWDDANHKWAAASAGTGLDAEGKFLAGNDYRVTATVELTDTQHYVIGANTKFYLAGEECTTNADADLHGTTDKKLTKISDTTYKLIQEFSISANDVAMVTVTYKEPVADQVADTAPTFKLADQVSGTHVKWYTMSDKPTDKNNGFTGGTELTTDYAAGTYYMAEATVEAKTGYTLDGDTVVSINDIQVTPNGDMGTKVNAKGEVTGWAMASISGGVITVKYITKTADVDTVIVSVDTGVTAPSEGGTPATAATTTQALNGSGYVVTTLGLADNGNVTISGSSWNGTLNENGKFKQGEKYSVTYTLTTKDGYTFLRDTTNNKYAAFKIAGLSVTLANESGTVKGSATSGSGDEELKVEVLSLTTNAAQIKITFPKITEDTGIEKVAVNYTVPQKGNKPATALNYTPPAPQVVLPQDELKTGNANGSTWHEGTNQTGSEVDKDTPFGDGDYTVATTFAAGDKVKFTSTTVFIVNGKEYQDTNTGNTTDNVSITDGGKTATVWHTFKGLDKTIVKVITAVTAPVAGATPQTKADTTLAANKGNINLLPDALTDAGKATINWTGDKNPDGTFKYSTTYTASFDLTVNTGDSYSYRDAAEYVDFLINGATDALNVKDGDNTTVTSADGNVTITKGTNKYTVTIKFPATKDNVQNVLEVHVDTILPPRYKNPIPAAAVRAPQPYEDVGTTAATKARWQKWADPDGDGTSEWVDVAANETFANGVKYRVTGQVHLKQDAATKRDYDITTATQFFIGDQEIAQNANNTAVTVSGVGAKATFAASTTADDGKFDDATTYTLTLEFDALTENKVIVDFGGNVLTPVTGGVATSDAYKNVSKLFAHNEDGDNVLAHVKVGDATWKSSTDNVNFGAMPADNTFVKDTYYQATFEVEADTEYSFASDINFLINGAMITGAGNATAPVKVDITGSGNKYTVTVTFPQTKDKADILTVWGLAVPEVGKTISSQTPTVPESEPYKAVAAGTKWEHWNKTSNVCEPATDSFLPGDRYKATIKTELKDTGATAGKYQFTTSTAGYINDTEAGKTTVTYLDASDNVIAAGADATPVYVQLEREFTMPKKTVEVHVKSDIPALGGTVATAQSSVGVDLVNYPDDANYYELTDTVTAGWYKDPEGTTAITDTEFAVGTYYLVVTVKPKEGYQLSESSGNYYWTTNNNQSSSIKPVVVNADNGEYRVAFLLKINEPGTTTTLQVKVPIPSKGDTTASKPGTSPDGSVNVDTTKWVSGTNTDGTDVGNFGEGQYTAVVYVKDVTPGETIYVNGNAETVKADADGETYVTYTYSIPVTPPAPPPVIHDTGSSGGTTELPQVFYKLGEVGVTDDLTAEKVRMNGKPSKVPKVEGIQIEDSDGTKKTYTFIGWSETDPAKTTGTPVLVDPTTFKISKDKTFYAVYEISGHTAIDHTHYVIGFPNGTFGPSADITRGEVATIIARACLDGFIEGANYGNPGGYSDVERHWAYSAISYCTMNSVFTGYTDGTFRPNQPITRQELATVVARLHGLIANQGVPFTDADQISKWARDGVYTAYAKGWIRGYKDGSFKPLQNITRAETVKVFNGYLGRGVDAKGLEEMREYVHSGVASNNQENGYDQYMTWPDVPKTHWAYYEIIEAANDHTFYWLDETNPVPPEHWSSVWIDEVWRYHDNSSDGARPVNPETSTPGY